MATLHVRNVPDNLYELLRERAAGEGRSIGAEVVNLLERAFAGQRSAPWLALRSTRRRSSKPFEHFSPPARHVIVDAQGEARSLASAVLGTEHLLLALCHERHRLPSAVLADAGLGLEQVRREVASVPPARGGTPAPEEGMPFTPAAKEALELALRESIDERCSWIEPRHLLLGIAREGEALGARILAAAGLDTAALRRALLDPLRPGSFELVSTAPGFRVVELDGEAADWERQLNALAGRGYELVEIVGRRAIFRVEMGA
jgi:ATP-dependent Clp protease ATP-binding subunit ClpA/plasmid stability protein